MNCLSAYLAGRPECEVLWLAPQPTNAPINVGSLRKALAEFDPNQWRGKRVALGQMPTLELLATLVLLDGLAAAILMLPDDDTPIARSGRLEQTRMDLVLEAKGLGISNAIDANCAPRESPPSAQGQCSLIPHSNLASPPAPTQWIIPTSGTTRDARSISHTFASLTRSMNKQGPSKPYIWGSLYSVRRFAGLQVFLQAWLARTPLVLREDSSDIAQTLAQLLKTSCNALSATPSMWRKLSMAKGFEKLPLQQITLGGEIVDQAVLDMLKHHFPAARITHIYASTEAGVGFAVRDGRAGFPLDFLNSAPNQVLIRIDAAQHLWFSTPPGTPKLAGLVADASCDEGWLDSGDVVQVRGDRVFFLGRANGAINVGGNKVMPEEVESVVNELPQVTISLARARPSSLMGNLIEVAVKLAPGAVLDAVFKAQLTKHCQARLEAFKVPAFVTELQDFELSAAGKISRSSRAKPL